MTSPGTHRYANGEKRRQELVDAALEVFATEGYRRLSLRQIAEKLGTSHVMLTYHFQSKAGLLQAVLARQEEREAGWRGSVLREHGLADGVSVIVDRNASMRGLIQLDVTLQAEAIDPAHPAHEFIRRREAGLYDAVLERLQLERGRGLIRDELDLQVATRQFTALLEGLQVQWLYDETIDMAAHMRAFVESLA